MNGMTMVNLIFDEDCDGYKAPRTRQEHPTLTDRGFQSLRIPSEVVVCGISRNRTLGY